MSLDIDLTSLFDSINIYLPMFFSIFAIAGGIGIAVLVAKLIINTISNAFKGGKL